MIQTGQLLKPKATIKVFILAMTLALTQTALCADELSKTPIEFAQLPGWQNQDVVPGFKAFLRNCQAGPSKSPGWSFETWDRICAAAKRVDPASRADIMSFFQTHFSAFAVDEDKGLFTGYYQPVAKASRKKKDGYTPLYRKPDDLYVVEDLVEFNPKLAGTRIAGHIVEGKFRPYYTRADISNGALQGKGLEIAWLESAADAFFIAVQGSGLLQFEDGTQLAISYGGANGHPYTAIGKVLIDWGEIAKKDISMQSIRAWLDANPSRQNELFNHNASYIFFKDIGDAPPEGGHGVGLTEKGSLAVDTRYIPLGTPLWLATESPDLQCLVVAQDVGSAIKGKVRGDFYWGTGHKAGAAAGQMAAKGTFFILEPKA